jgi:hypothetical protein
MTTITLTYRYARYLLTSLPTTAFGMTMQEPPQWQKGGHIC